MTSFLLSIVHQAHALDCAGEYELADAIDPKIRHAVRVGANLITDMGDLGNNVNVQATASNHLARG